jgi:hypothetical protein
MRMLRQIFVVYKQMLDLAKPSNCAFIMMRLEDAASSFSMEVARVTTTTSRVKKNVWRCVAANRSSCQYKRLENHAVYQKNKALALLNISDTIMMSSMMNVDHLCMVAARVMKTTLRVKKSAMLHAATSPMHARFLNQVTVLTHPMPAPVRQQNQGGTSTHSRVTVSHSTMEAVREMATTSAATMTA